MHAGSNSFNLLFFSSPSFHLLQNPEVTISSLTLGVPDGKKIQPFFSVIINRITLLLAGGRTKNSNDHDDDEEADCDLI